MTDAAPDPTAATQTAATLVAARARKGLCVCCGVDPARWGAPAVGIGEGVLLCADCVDRCHDDADHVAWLLEAAISGGAP